METQQVNEAQFKHQLWKWKTVGRTLINLPKIDKQKQKLEISIVGIDNITCYVLNRTFDSYQQILAWYGGMLDELA